MGNKIVNTPQASCAVKVDTNYQHLDNEQEQRLIQIPLTKPLPPEWCAHQLALEKQNETLQQLQMALEISRAHYVDLYDSAPVGYLSLNADGVITEINLTAAKLLHAERQTIINREFVEFVVADYQDLWHRHFQLAQQSKGKYGCELPFSDGQGTANYYYHLDCLKIGTGNVDGQMRITFTDVTERKQIEIELQIAAVAFEAQESIMVTDAQRVIQRVNKAFTRITGYSAEEAIGQTPYFLRSGFHDDAFYCTISNVVKNEGYWQGEIWDKRKNGEVFPVLQTITAVTDREGRITHFVGTMVDITAQKQAEKVLLEAQARLESQVITTQDELEKNKHETADVNTALNVLLKHRELDKTQAQTVLSDQVAATVLPLLKSLKGLLDGQGQTARLANILEANLQQLVKSYGRAANLAAVYQKFTPIEIQVASLIRQGLPTKVIAATLNISSGTVSIHRKHIRKKLGLASKAVNLHSYLVSLAE